MPRKGFSPEQIIFKLRQVEVLFGQGMSIANAQRGIAMAGAAACFLAQAWFLFPRLTHKDIESYKKTWANSNGRTRHWNNFLCCRKTTQAGKEKR